MGLFGFVPVPVATLTASTVLLLYLYWRERRTTKRLLSLKTATVTKVLFFPENNVVNRPRSLEKLSNTLKSAVSSLDVCVYAISNWTLIDILIGAHQRGVAVRVITDKDQLSLNPSHVERLRRSGIQVRRNNDSYFMHHKFAVVDGCYLVTGSLNWTQQAVHGNQENVLISSSSDVVRPFLEQFEVLWEQFHPQHYCPTDLT